MHMGSIAQVKHGLSDNPSLNTSCDGLSVHKEFMIE